MLSSKNDALPALKSPLTGSQPFFFSYLFQPERISFYSILHYALFVKSFYSPERLIKDFLKTKPTTMALRKSHLVNVQKRD